jgi:hypothetical protein
MNGFGGPAEAFQLRHRRKRLQIPKIKLDGHCFPILMYSSYARQK